MKVKYYSDHLYHYGVKGMRWGVRHNYEKFSGSYTRRGVQRFHESDRKHTDAKNKYKATKEAYKQGKATKYDVKYSRSKMKEAKRQLNKDFKHLHQDKLADQGKVMYREGKRITGNYQQLKIAAGVASVAAYIYRSTGNKKVMYAAAAAEAAVGAMAVRNMYRDKRLRAYYAHTSNY